MPQAARIACAACLYLFLIHSSLFSIPFGGAELCPVRLETNPKPLPWKLSKYAMRSSVPSEKVCLLINSFAREPASARIFERHGHSRADFVAKLQIALKECAESEYWLELLIESGYYSDSAILEQCVEMKKLLISSINTAKKNMK